LGGEDSVGVLHIISFRIATISKDQPWGQVRHGATDRTWIRLKHFRNQKPAL
jgi:hypothetical protein